MRLLLLSMLALGFTTPQGPMINRAIHGPMVQDSDECSLGSPYTDWVPHLAFSGEADSSRFGAFAHVGTGPSGYDITAPGNGAPATTNGPKWRTAANCNGAPYGCLEFDRASDFMTMAGDLSESWAKNIQCVVAYFPGNAVDYVYATVDNAAFFEYNFSKAGYRYGGPGFVRSTAFGSTGAGWHAICGDMTTKNGPVAVDGVVALADMNLPTVQGDPVRVSIAGFNSYNSGDAIGLQLGRLLFYKTDPGKTVAELSACLASQWGI